VLILPTPCLPRPSQCTVALLSLIKISYKL